ncbi:MAG: flavin reductase family protein [Oscillospiraceae bacterium]
MDFVSIPASEINDSVFHLIGSDWMLLSAGTEESFNTMTASWGAFGVLWKKNTATVYIRPLRYTCRFFHENTFFSMCFFDEEHRKDLNYIGSHSGRDENKLASTALMPIFLHSPQAPIFEQAKLAVICKKLYEDCFRSECFADSSPIADCYPQLDFHRFFIGEISEVLIRR